MPLKEVFAQAERPKDEVHMLLIGIVERVEGVVASRLRRTSRINDTQILKPARGLNVRQQALEEIALTLTIEDNHRHTSRAEATHQILSDDVFKKRGFARAGASDNDTVFHPHAI